jgi:hypothetical protein
VITSLSSSSHLSSGRFRIPTEFSYLKCTTIARILLTIMIQRKSNSFDFLDSEDFLNKTYGLATTDE